MLNCREIVIFGKKMRILLMKLMMRKKEVMGMWILKSKEFL